MYKMKLHYKDRTKNYYSKEVNYHFLATNHPELNREQKKFLISYIMWVSILLHNCLYMAYY